MPCDARLNSEIENVAKMRDAYTAQCRALAGADDVKILAAKQKLEVAESRVEGIKAEIASKERLLDEAQGRVFEENRRRQLEADFELASERLATSQAEIERLRAEYSAFSEKIRVAEWNFHLALRAFNAAKEA